MSLTFDVLREANIKRLPTFRNSKGEIAHSQKDGSDWSPAQWLQAVVGELGEYANVRKKFERGDIGPFEFKTLARKELADVMTYLDILAMQLDIDLGRAVLSKFNEVSERVGSLIRIHEDGTDWCLSRSLTDDEAVRLNQTGVYSALDKASPSISDKSVVTDGPEEKADATA